MKTIPALSFIAALVAFILLPVSFEIGGSLLFAGGLLTIAFSDYHRLPAVAGVALAPRRRIERLRLAA